MAIAAFGRTPNHEYEPILVNKQGGVIVDEEQMKGLVREVLAEVLAHCPECPHCMSLSKEVKG